MDGRFAVLLDGGFVRKRLELRRRLELEAGGVVEPKPEEIFPSAEVVLEHVRRLSSHERLSGKDLLRIYFYDAPPLDGLKRNPLNNRPYDLGKQPTNRLNRRLQDSLAHSPDVAVRRGELVFHGWKVRGTTVDELKGQLRDLMASDLAPDIEQKGVDLRIGLDIALLAFKHIVDTIVLISGDSDLVPALKLARREGLRVYLDPMGMANRIRPSLSEHVDYVFRETWEAVESVRMPLDARSPDA